MGLKQRLDDWLARRKKTKEEAHQARELERQLHEQIKKEEYYAYRRRLRIAWALVLITTLPMIGIGFYQDNSLLMWTGIVWFTAFALREFFMDLILMEIIDSLGCFGLLIFGIFLIGWERRRAMRRYGKKLKELEQNTNKRT